MSACGAFLLCLLCAGCGSADAPDQKAAFSGEETPDDFLSRGERIYLQQCASCHQGSGHGIDGIYPPLTETRWVTGSDKLPVLLVLHGLVGEIEVKGRTYRGLMPGAPHLSDEDIAAVVSYIRQAWGNEAPPVSPERVRELREAFPSRTGPWTEEELEAKELLPWKQQ